MVKKRTLHFLITISSIIVTTALGLLPEPAARYVVWFCPGLFLSILSGILCGFFPALLVGALPPVLTFLVRYFSLEGFDYTIYVPMAVFAVSGVVSAAVYAVLGTSIGASVSGVLSGRLVLGVMNLVIYHLIGRTYTVRMFAEEGFIAVWAGLLLAILLIPLLIRMFRRYGIMKLLKNEKPAL